MKSKNKQNVIMCPCGQFSFADPGYDDSGTPGTFRSLSPPSPLSQAGCLSLTSLCSDPDSPVGGYFLSLLLFILIQALDMPVGTLMKKQK